MKYVIIIKLGTVTAPDMIMIMPHHVLIILTLTFNQGRTERNHKNSKYSIISETDCSSNIYQVCCEDIVRLKVYIIFSQSNYLDLIRPIGRIRDVNKKDLSHHGLSSEATSTGSVYFLLSFFSPSGRPDMTGRKKTKFVCLFVCFIA